MTQIARLVIIGKFPLNNVAKLKEFEMSICIICKGENQISEHNPLTDEHIVPEFIGGSLTVKNVCKVCNSNMGTGFEGELANSLFYKLPRFIHNIEGKQNKLSTPFCGTYENDDIGRFQVLPNGDLYLIPDITINNNESGLDISMAIDISDLSGIEKHLEKKLSRYFKSQGEEISKNRIVKLVSEVIEHAEKKYHTKDHLKISCNISLDFDSQVMLYTKIAYELAIYHFGDEYINDPIANKLRLVLKNQKIDKTIHGQFPVDNLKYNSYFDDEHHWVMFKNNACFIKIFGMPAIIEYSSRGAAFCEKEGVVYKFCYKTLSFRKLSLIEHINLARQSTRIVERWSEL